MKKKLYAMMLAASMAAITVTGCTLDLGNIGSLIDQENDEDDDKDKDDKDKDDDGKDDVLDGDGMTNTENSTLTITVPYETSADEDVYVEVLDKMYNLISNPDEAEWDYEDGSMGVLEVATYSSNPLADIGYIRSDLNGDGVNELLIGSVVENYTDIPGNEVYAVYTVVNGRAQLALQGRARYTKLLTNDNRFLYYASNGAFNYGFGFDTLTTDGVVSSDAVYVDLAPNGEDLAVYSNPAGVWDANDTYLSDMTMDEMEELYNEYAMDTQFIYFTPFEFYGSSLSDAGSVAILPLYISLGSPEDAVSTAVLSSSEYATSAALYANSNIKDINFYQVSNVDMEKNDEITYTAEAIYAYGDLASGEEIELVLTVPEIYPEYIVAFVDVDGAQRYYAIQCSGEDGSLYFNVLQ